MSGSVTTDAPLPRENLSTRPGEVASQFGLLGITSFGGPTAHLGYFRTAFVERRRWLSDATYADVVAVSQFLPGPASSQVGMALGYHRGSWAGMALAWLLFTLPSAAILAVFGLFVELYEVDGEAGWIRGLLAVAVAVVFHAVSGMAKSMANTPLKATIAVVAALAILFFPHSATHIAVILAAGVIGWLALRDPAAAASDDSAEEAVRTVSPAVAITAIITFFALLGGLWAGAHFIGGYFFTRAFAFYETGALVFGGGHVVLPLLQHHAVGGGWMGQEEFITGYSAAQAVPGPLFTFASYLGAVDGGIAGSILATVMIFLPSALLIIAGLHFWSRWRRTAWLKGAFAAINAAVVGILLAAFYDPIIAHGVTDVPSLAVAALCWLMLAQFKLPPWAVAAVGALAGLLIL